ncbi:hypothetical protein C8R41DRAFT_867134 [Lentinula lateritia]|uniref:Uncharacterized protein n=1 Tax=Lentinula lateritia TaxID=40482 RepID=A0ABQ8VGN9_9AGAR|nr:hypothetical protein C8R41DRAFT_867134 [Lentinula lateritia]
MWDEWIRRHCNKQASNGDDAKCGTHEAKLIGDCPAAYTSLGTVAPDEGYIGREVDLLASRKSTPVSFEPIQKAPKYFMEGKDLPYIENGSYGPTKLETTNFNSKDSQGITAWYYGQAPHDLDRPPEETTTPPKQGTIYLHRNIADGGYQIWIWLAQSEWEIWLPVDLNGALVHHPEIPARVLTLQALTGNPSWVLHSTLTTTRGRQIRKTRSRTAVELYIRAVKLICLNPPIRVLPIFKLLEMIPKPKITVAASRRTICLPIMEKGKRGARGITLTKITHRRIALSDSVSIGTVTSLFLLIKVTKNVRLVAGPIADIPVATEMHETESNYDSDNNEEIPHQVSESHNLNARVKTTLMPVEQDNQQRADSINEPLNDVDSSIKYFVDANSSVDQFEKNEKTYAKQENERLHGELKELKSQMSARIRCDIAEHTHLNVLNRLLIQTRSEYLQNKLSRSAMSETFDNLSSQLRELADRRLENMPVGLGSILDLIKTSEIVNDKSPSKKQSHS